MSHILLTGGAGFIGSHTAEVLLRRGAQLTIVDNLDDFYSLERKKNNLAEIRRVGRYEFWNLDICEIDKLRRVMELSKPDMIIHLAARAGVRVSIDQPELYERINVAGTRNLLELARDFKIKRFLFGSSSSVYGETTRVPFREDEPDLKPISPYASTKLSAEMLCQAYAHLYGLSVIALRLFSVYGPRQRPDLVVHKFTALLEAGAPLPIFGDGTGARDYTYVDDIVSGVLAALDCKLQPDEKGGSYEIFNLGRSSPVKVIDLVGMLERLTRRKAVLDWMHPQYGDLPMTWADLSKSSRFLAYAPAIQLEEGLNRFYTWYRRNSASARA